MKGYMPFMFVGLLFVLLPTADADSRFRQQLSTLLSENVKQKEACDAYRTGLRAAEHLDGADEGYLDKQTALRVMLILKSRPATHPSTKELGRMLLEPVDAADLHWLGSRIGDMQHSCAPVDIFVNLRRLLKEHAALGFSDIETRRLRQFAFQYLKEESTYPAQLVQGAALLALAKELHQAGMLVLDPGDLRRIEARINQLKALVRSHTQGDFNEAIFARYVIEETRRSYDVARWLQRRVVNVETGRP